MSEQTVEIDKRRVRRSRVNELSLLNIVFHKGKSGVRFSALIADVSLGGMRLLFPAVHFSNIDEFSDSFEPGKELFIAATFKTSRNEFCIKCTVRWVGLTVGYDSHPFSVGLEFDKETELPAPIGTYITV